MKPIKHFNYHLKKRKQGNLLMFGIFMILALAALSLDFIFGFGAGIIPGVMFATIATAGVAGESETDQEQKTITDIFKDESKNFFEELKKVMGEVKAAPVGDDRHKDLLHTDANYQLSYLLTAMKSRDPEALKEIKALIVEGYKAVTAPAIISNVADGGYLVPTLTDASIRFLVETMGQALKLCTVVPMGGNPTNFPKMTAGLTWNWVAENAQIGASKATIGVDLLTPYKGAALCPLSNELLKYSNPAIGAFVARWAAMAEAYGLDTKVFQNGNSIFTGVFYASNTFGNTENLSTSNPNSITYQNLLNASLGVDLNYNPNPAWHMSRSVLALCIGILDQNLRPIFDYSTKTLLGYPVNIVEQAPNSADSASKPIIIFGDLRNSLLGDVVGRDVNFFDQASVTINGTLVSAVEYDLTVFRLTKSYSFAPGMTNAYSIIKTHA